MAAGEGLDWFEVDVDWRGCGAEAVVECAEHEFVAVFLGHELVINHIILTRLSHRPDRRQPHHPLQHLPPLALHLDRQIPHLPLPAPAIKHPIPHHEPHTDILLLNPASQHFHEHVDLEICNELLTLCLDFGVFLEVVESAGDEFALLGGLADYYETALVGGFEFIVHETRVVLIIHEHLKLPVLLGEDLYLLAGKTIQLRNDMGSFAELFLELEPVLVVLVEVYDGDGGVATEKDCYVVVLVEIGLGVLVVAGHVDVVHTTNCDGMFFEGFKQIKIKLW